MTNAAAVIYLEADDEVTSVIRRLRAADPGPVLVVAPGRSRATSSVVALRLLGRAAEADGRSLAVVGDALTRSLAHEAGVPAHASIEEARRADPDAAPAAEAQHAPIHVVRGPSAEGTAPTLAAAAAPSTADDVTRPVPIARAARPKPGVRPAAGQRGRRTVPLAAFGALGLLLLAGVVAAAALLPGATVTLVPRSQTIGPIRYTIELDDAERLEGTVSATTEVVATGTYAIQEPAGGAVVLFNWTFFPVDVPAGTFVAAGEQAFATQEAVTVPRGRLTGEGTIAAGEAEVAVVAAAPGPAANVAAEAINVVVDEDTDARLRGFMENTRPRVLNPAPTTGGVDTGGAEITQEDVDAAVATLTEALREQAAEAVEAAGDEIIMPSEPSEPVVEGTDGLAGTRDRERVEISGELTYAAERLDPESVIRAAEQRFAADAAAIPDGHELLPGSVAAALGEVTRADNGLSAEASVTAEAAPIVDRGAVIERIAGRDEAEAEAALADVGEADVQLWPGWVTSVPTIEWRVEVRIGSAEATSEPDPS